MHTRWSDTTQIRVYHGVSVLIIPIYCRDKKSKNALLHTLEKVLICHKTEAGNVLVSVFGNLTKEVASR